MILSDIRSSEEYLEVKDGPNALMDVHDVALYTSAYSSECVAKLTTIRTLTEIRGTICYSSLVCEEYHCR